MSAYWISGTGGCTPSLEQVCLSRYARFDQEVRIAQQRLMDSELSDKAEGRMPASIKPQEVPEGERRRWQKWAEERLSEAQNGIDLATYHVPDSDAARHLGRVADHMVEIHAYAQLGRMDRIAETLRKVQFHSESAFRAACK